MGNIKAILGFTRLRTFAVVILFFFGGIFLGWQLRSIVSKGQQIPNPVSGCIREPGYKFISPLLLCGINTAKNDAQFQSLQNKLKLSIFDAINNSSVEAVSIYFRDFISSQWTGIDENLDYNPASLLKVPIMIAYYKQAESDPTILQKKIFYTPGSETDFVTLTPGQFYTAEELIRAMIVNSDNVAKTLLLSHIDQGTLRSIFSNLGVPFFGDPSIANYQISAKTYALFFRVLYNSTYLTRDASERALELLSTTTYNDGLIAGVPASTTVAHKYGEYAPKDSAGNILSGMAELHDCGIVYVPGHPYLICVMTRGSDLNDLQKIIQQISKAVYQEAGTTF